MKNMTLEKIGTGRKGGSKTDKSIICVICGCPLEQEENKVLRAQMDLAQAKQEIERRLQEKEEEFENTRKNFARALDSMQASLDGEMKAKEEVCSKYL